MELEQTDVNCTTFDGQTPLDLVKSPKLIRLLLKHGATPTYKLYNEYFPHYLCKHPTDMSIKMFVLGHPDAGKSTLVESLKKSFSQRFVSRFSRVKNVNRKTVGIIPHDLNCRLLGKVSLYDFAGHEQFHSGHEALLSNSMANSPSIVMLVVDVTIEEKNFKRAICYWLEFINNQCSVEDPKPHLVLICSHDDQSKNKRSKLSKMQLALSLIQSYKFNCVGQVTMDCRKFGSPSMSELHSVLAKCCQDLRNRETVAIEHHCFLIFLLDTFLGKTAITLSEARLRITDENYLRFLKSCNLFEVCQQLNKRGDILFMKHDQNPEKSWIILEKTTLLTKVNGVLFAPEGFKEHQKIASSTGVVPLSKLIRLFPDFDSDMIRQFLCHLEFCQEIADSELLKLLPADNNLNQVGERFFFFPGLVLDLTPQDLWQPMDDLGFHLGWAIQCSKPEQFLPHRFLQVLLLRLAFNFAFAPSEPLTVNHPALQRRCKIWKSGISWANIYGGEAVVEVTNHRKVTVVTRCNKEFELESGRLLSAIIYKVLETKNEYCPNSILTESVILSEDAANYCYPVDLTQVATVSIIDMARNVNENAHFFVHENKHIRINKFHYFEPYFNLGEQILQELLDEENPNHYQRITEEFMDKIAEQMHHKTSNYIAILNKKPSSTTGNVQNLVQELQKWKVNKGSQATRCNLHKLLDQFSVFAGRNPLKVAAGMIYTTSIMNVILHACIKNLPNMIVPHCCLLQVMYLFLLNTSPL